MRFSWNCGESSSLGIDSSDDSSQMLPTLDQIRDVKLMEEEEALEMGREAATIRHLF